SDYVQGSNLRVEAAARILRPRQRLLDIGCGDGVLGVLVRDRFEEIYGIDISDKAVELARQRGIKAYCINLNAEKLPFEDSYFDSITCLSTLQCIYDIIFALREFNRVLRLDGELILTVPNMRTFWRIFKLAVLGDFPRTSFYPEGYDGGTLHYFCFSNLKSLLEKTGFKVDMHRGIFCQPRFLEKVPDKGLIGKLKAEFLGAEMLVRVVKGR
ncbi:class I SAM-dependent methyltransferase, partial [Leptodesmis sp.]|uniref:class I SAM-dependent methyltransferase n=1 Tax=Leptodesmis sp. TaxID=3100501 RepID=UPI0040534F9E